MSNTDKTTLGDRMKGYEQPSTSRKAFKGQPLIARLDGKSFHTFCRGLQRPYDRGLSDLMVHVTKSLVDRFQAKVGYTQSDEITLAWHYPTNSSAEFPFDGRFQKMESLLAAYASAVFNEAVSTYLSRPENPLAIFDCRAFVVPTLEEAYHAFLWRQQDCTKNAISMAAQSMFSHKSLQGMHGPEMQERMFKEKGINFNDYPFFFKRGTFVKRAKVFKELDEVALARIPADRRPTGPIERTEVQIQDIWLAKEDHAIDVLFYDVPPTGTQAYLRSLETSKIEGRLVLLELENIMARYITRRTVLASQWTGTTIKYHLRQLSLDVQIGWCNVKMVWYS